MRFIYFLFLFFDLCSVYLRAQSLDLSATLAKNQTIDSLQTLLKKDKSDTSKVIHLYKLCREYEQIGLFDMALYYGDAALKLANQLQFKKGIGFAYHNMGNSYLSQGNYLKAISNYGKAIDVRKDINDKKGIANSYNNIANCYLYQGNYQEALKNYFSSLEVRKEINDKEGIAQSVNSIGVIYNYQGNYPEALKNYLKALTIREEIKDLNGIATSYDDIGSVYAAQGNYKDALKNYAMSLKIRLDIKDKEGIASSYNNIGGIYVYEGNYSEGIKNYFQSLTIRKEMNDKKGISISYSNIGSIYHYQKNYPEALKYYYLGLQMKEEILDQPGIALSYLNLGGLHTQLHQLKEAQLYLTKALNLSKEIGYVDITKETYRNLTKLDSTQGNWKDAYIHHKLFTLYRDSIDNEESRKKMVESTMTYEFEKKEAAAKAIQDKKDAIANENKNKQQIILFSIAGMLIIVILFSGFLYSRYKVINKQHKIIEQQKRKLEEVKEQEKIVLEQKLLRSQMNPHFLFNSLDTIQSYIHNGKKTDAVIYLAKFGKLTRQILDNSREEYVLLENELATLDNYLALQQLLFEEKFTYSITVDDNIDKEALMIPPMLAQPFIENALKHGIKHLDGKGQIEVNFYLKNEKLLFEVIDNGIGIEKSKILKQEGHRSLATTITEERLTNINKNRINKITISLIDILNDRQDIIGVKLSFEIPYIYVV